MKLDKKTLATVGLTLLFTIVAIVLLTQIMKIMGIGVQGMKPFVYTGKNTKQEWYAWIVPLAKQVGAEHGIPWQAIAVQTAVETGWGKSSLLTKHNNFGGIKLAGSGAPSFVALPTTEYINGQKTTVTSKFASWPTPYEGLIGYARFFHRNKRYATALKYPNDPKRFIEEIKKAGYATDPNYVAKLHSLLNDLKTA